MSVRNSVKAIIVEDGRILLNRCESSMGEYYSLPGGGQRLGETLQETLQREVMEETGYHVQPLRLSGIYERISPNRSDVNAHKIYHIFSCKLSDADGEEPMDMDQCQLGIEWVPIRQLSKINLFPRAIRDNIRAFMKCEETFYVGSERDFLSSNR